MAAATTKAATAAMDTTGVVVAQPPPPFVEQSSISVTTMQVVNQALVHYDTNQGHNYENIRAKTVCCILANRAYNSSVRAMIGNDPEEMFAYLAERGIDGAAQTILTEHPSLKTNRIKSFNIIIKIAEQNNKDRIKFLSGLGFQFSAAHATTTLAKGKYVAFCEIFSYLSEEDVRNPPYANGDQKRTWIHLVAGHDDSEAMATVISRYEKLGILKTTVNNVDGAGQTALHIAAAGNNGFSVRGLLTMPANADHTIKNKDQEIAFQLLPAACWLRATMARGEFNALLGRLAAAVTPIPLVATDHVPQPLPLSKPSVVLSASSHSSASSAASTASKTDVEGATALVVASHIEGATNTAPNPPIKPPAQKTAATTPENAHSPRSTVTAESAPATLSASGEAIAKKIENDRRGSIPDAATPTAAAATHSSAAKGTPPNDETIASEYVATTAEDGWIDMTPRHLAAARNKNADSSK